MEFPASFFFTNKRLLNHTIKIIDVLDMDLCELMCYQEPNCVSFNFRKKPENGEVKHRCELNNSTHLEYDSEFKDDPSYFYRGAKVRVTENLTVKTKLLTTLQEKSFNEQLNDSRSYIPYLRVARESLKNNSCLNGI